jgi:TetR/AcrR family transcriptional repressor of mexJK operon
MARPATNHEARKAEIVAAAIRSFATYGYEGTSNKTIAQAGGFKSPALIYHYFLGGKPELFQACLEEFQPLKTFQHSMEGDFDAPLDVYLRKLALNYLEMVQDETVGRVIRIILTEAPRFPELAEIIPRRMFPVMVQPTLVYLSKYVANGQLQVKQPVALAMQFFGPLFARTILRMVGVTDRVLPVPFPNDEEFVESMVETFLHGVLKDPTGQTTQQE